MKKNELLNMLVNDISDLAPCKDGYKYEIDFNSTYGGYRLVLVNLSNGGHSGCFGGNACEPRVKFSEFENKLRTIISVCQYFKK